MLMVASNPSAFYGLNRRIEQAHTKLRHETSMITEREFEKRKRRRQIADASKRAQRGKRMN